MPRNHREPPNAPDGGAVAATGDAAQPGTKAAFLAAYARCGNVTEAAAAGGVTQQAHQRWLTDDEHYGRSFAAAGHEARDALEAEARRRALRGVEEDVYHQGRVVGTRRVYSDTLLVFLLSRAPLPDSPSPASDHEPPRADLLLRAEIDELLNSRPTNGHRH